MIRIAFILRAPEIGGTERRLVELLKGLDPLRFQSRVFLFYKHGRLRQEFESIPGVTLHDLDKKGRWDMAGFTRRLRRAIREMRPDVVFGCLGVANELALLVGRLEGVKVVWSLGASFMDLSLYDWTARPLFELGKRLSGYPDRIVINSHAGLEYHRAQGWDVARMDVIPNGFDTTRFARDPDAGAAVRRELGIGADELVVGMCARIDPIKNHALLLDAAARLIARHPHVRFVCVGGGDFPELRARLERDSEARSLGSRVLWTGTRNDTSAVFNAFDIPCLCSLGAGLPNAVGEAMASEVPNVVTDVGDAARVVGDTGRSVPSNDAPALAAALESMIVLSPDQRRAFGVRARQRIIDQYRSELLAQRTGDLVARVVQDAPSPRRS
jgi:glycosyltransferase involved in cell wall biosynthesis